MTVEAELTRLVWEGFERLKSRGRLTAAPEAEYRAQVERELSVVAEVNAKKKRAVGYGTWADFLLVTQDYANKVRARGVYIGPGRGSAAASMMCWCLGITQSIDPIRFRLIFERFLNPARVSSPDIDLDFSDQETVFSYLIERYGANRVVRISAPAYMKPKGALKQAAMVLNLPFTESNLITAEYDRVEEENQLLDTFDDVDSKLLDKALELSDHLVEWDRTYPKLFPIARRFVGVLSGHSTHPAGVLVLQRPCGAELPLMQIGSGKSKGIRTAWDCKALEAIGYVKLDILAVTNLNIIMDTIQMVKERHGVVVVPDDIPLADEKTTRLLSSGDLIGIFQIADNQVANQMAKELPAESVEDVALINAAIRPGIEWQKMIENKRNPEMTYYPIEGLRTILADSYGVFTYQEQIMFAVRDLAGFSMEEADQVRRVVATTSNAKLQYDINTYRERFVNGCVRQGHDERAAEAVWKNIEALANYCFNKAHALAYGLVAWHEAYLKARWPAEYLCACINDVVRKGWRDRYEKFVIDAKAHKIKVIAPDVNRSKGEAFVNSDGTIVLGLGMILNVGSAGHDIPKKAPYSSFPDFCERSGVVSRAVKLSSGGELFAGESLIAPGSLDDVTASLIRAGAFDSIHPRASLLKSCYPDTAITPMLTATWEQEVVGLFLTANPLADFMLDMQDWIQANADPRRKGQGGGLVTEIFTSKGGHGFITVRTQIGKMELVCWADEWGLVKEQIRVGMVITGELYKTKRGNYAISNLGEMSVARGV